MRAPLLLLAAAVLTACPRPAGDPVTVECSYRYVFDDRVDTGLYSSYEMSCDSYAEQGWQSLEGTRLACEQEGEDQGANTVECTCEFDIPASCDPDSIAD